MYSDAAAPLKHKTHFRAEVARRPPLEILSYPLRSQFTCEWGGEISFHFQNEHVQLSEYTLGDPRSSLEDSSSIYFCLLANTPLGA